ncbi:MAG: NAD(+) synthase, partial [Heliobacteriaceae bacterium]|nr:NAD(+) synthase [Heliobacteriaceae bacterium]
FPALLGLGEKDLQLDEKFRAEQVKVYERLAVGNFSAALLIGNVLIKDGKISEYKDGMFEGLHILAENKYFVMKTLTPARRIDLRSQRERGNNFIYVNAVCMADESIYAGGSFAKNAAGEIVYQAPLCEEAIKIIDFASPLTPALSRGEREQQVIDVMTFALCEYCENTGLKKVVIGLSGGIDSALTAALAVKALGKDNVFGVLMPSMYSSEGSVTDALALAQNLGIKTVKHAITPLFENFMNEVVHERHSGLAEENLQARLRMLIVMFYSNRDGYLMLSTGNKSESAMGYGTLYGDLAGGLNLVADLTKTNVYKVADYINKDGEIIPQNTITKAPSAELKPGQKDRDSLPEYAILDDIIEMYFEQNLPHEQIYAKYGQALVDDVIKRVYRAQFKRKQCGLGIRLTERAFSRGINLPVVQKFY